jgi:hypothetical protein
MSTAEMVGSVDVEEIADSMRRTGFGRVENAMPADDLRSVQAVARDAVRRAGNESAYLAPDALAGTALGELAGSPELHTFLAQLHAAAAQRPPAPRESIYAGLRCLYGRTGAASSLQYHFDSYTVTALLPVEIPTSGNRGDFLYYPNLRAVRRSALVNIAEKAACQNGVTRRVLASQAFRQRIPPRRLELVPGNLYVFWGYRTLHGNDICDPDQLRATALFHFGDPHLEDPLVQRVHRRVERSGRTEQLTSSAA